MGRVGHVSAGCRGTPWRPTRTAWRSAPAGGCRPRTEPHDLRRGAAEPDPPRASSAAWAQDRPACRDDTGAQGGAERQARRLALRAVRQRPDGHRLYGWGDRVRGVPHRLQFGGQVVIGIHGRFLSVQRVLAFERRSSGRRGARRGSRAPTVIPCGHSRALPSRRGRRRRRPQGASSRPWSGRARLKWVVSRNETPRRWANGAEFP